MMTRGGMRCFERKKSATSHPVNGEIYILLLNDRFKFLHGFFFIRVTFGM